MLNVLIHLPQKCALYSRPVRGVSRGLQWEVRSNRLYAVSSPMMNWGKLEVKMIKRRASFKYLQQSITKSLSLDSRSLHTFRSCTWSLEIIFSRFSSCTWSQLICVKQVDTFILMRSLDSRKNKADLHCLTSSTPVTLALKFTSKMRANSVLEKLSPTMIRLWYVCLGNLVGK